MIVFNIDSSVNRRNEVKIILDVTTSLTVCLRSRVGIPQAFLLNCLLGGYGLDCWDVSTEEFHNRPRGRLCRIHSFLSSFSSTTKVYGSRQEADGYFWGINNLKEKA